MLVFWFKVRASFEIWVTFPGFFRHFIEAKLDHNLLGVQNWWHEDSSEYPFISPGSATCKDPYKVKVFFSFTADHLFLITSLMLEWIASHVILVKIILKLFVAKCTVFFTKPEYLEAAPCNGIPLQVEMNNLSWKKYQIHELMRPDQMDFD